MEEIKEKIEIFPDIFIDDIDNIIKGLKIQLGDTGDVFYIDAVWKFMREEKNTLFYMDKNLAVKDSAANSEYVWLDTGVEDRLGVPVFVSLRRMWNGTFSGHYVSNYKRIADFIAEKEKHHAKKIRSNRSLFYNVYKERTKERERVHLSGMDLVGHEITKKESSGIMFPPIPEIRFLEEEPPSEKSQPFSEITEKLWPTLMYQNWKSQNGLERYIKICACRLEELIAAEKEEYYMLANDGTAIINTGLLNKYGEDILLVYKRTSDNSSFVSEKVVASKGELLKMGFAKEECAKEVLPISFFDDEKTFFDASLEDFDINLASIEHIIEQRRDRIPEELRNIPDNVIVSRIKDAIELGVKLQKRDKSYIKASYSSQTKGISWFFPLHIIKPLTEEPELVLAVRKCNGFYEAKTILPYDDNVKDRIRCMSLYSETYC